MRVLFVGEKRSPSAIRMDVHWPDKRLAGKQLFDAFESLSVDTEEFEFCNVMEPSIGRIDEAIEEGIPIVAMGKLAQSVLTKMGVKHTAMIHPAARGTIRRKSNYSQHVEEVLAVVKGSKPQRE